MKRFAIIYRVYDSSQNAWKISARIVQAGNVSKAEEILAQKAIKEGFSEENFAIIGSDSLGPSQDYFKLIVENGIASIIRLDLEDYTTQAIQIVSQQMEIPSGDGFRSRLKQKLLEKFLEQSYVLTKALFVNKLPINKFSMIDIF